MKEYDIYKFAKEILGIDIPLAHQQTLNAIQKLNKKYGTHNWHLDFGRRGNPVVIINKAKRTIKNPLNKGTISKRKIKEAVKKVIENRNKKKVKYRYCSYCKKDTVTIKDNAGIDYVIVCGTCGHAWIQTK